MMASPPSLASLRLLVPPLRLMTAAMWQVARRQSVQHYGMLEDFVALVSETVPQLLTDRQRSLLLLALRAKVTLSDPASQDVLARSVCETTAAGGDLSSWLLALPSLAHRLARSPEDRERLLQEVFGHTFDAALLSFIRDVLSRMEQLIPVPDFQQVASWLDAAPGGAEDFLQEADNEEVKQLLTNQSSGTRRVVASVSPQAENTLLSAWSHPLLTKLTNPEPPAEALLQSDQLPATLEAGLVKVEVVVMTEDEQVEETVITDVLEAGPQEASNQSSGGHGDTCVAAGDEDKCDRLMGPPPGLIHQSGDSVGQSEEPSSELTANPLSGISHNAQRVAHRCPQCGRCFIYRSQVIRHLRTSKSCSSSPAGPRPLEPRPPRAQSCFQCNTVFKTKAELLSHQRSHRARPVYRCGQCDRSFSLLSSLTNHRQTHLEGGGASFSCSKCEKVFDSSKERDAHRLQHRLPDLACSMCVQTFTSHSQLLRHLQTHAAEGEEPRYNCRFCDQTFTGVTQLRIHQRSHTFRTHQCDLCSKAYSSLPSLHAHRASHGSDSRFLCPQCGKRFKTRDGLEGHLRRHRGERPYRCPYCPKDFTALAGLNVHVRRHTGERPYVCSVCGKGWPSGGDLQKHMRTHTGERPYTCLDCGKAFAISCHLTEHRRIHTGEKPFTCPQCGKCLRRKFDLKKHLLSHSSVRPHACSYCPKSYTRKTHLNRHLLTHQGAGEGAGLKGQ